MFARSIPPTTRGVSRCLHGRRRGAFIAGPLMGSSAERADHTKGGGAQFLSGITARWAHQRDIATVASGHIWTLIPQGVFARLDFGTSGAPHRVVFTATRVQAGAARLPPSTLRKGETSCAVPPPAAPAARPATPDAVNTSSTCFPVCRSNNAAAAHPTPAPPADRCCHDCSVADLDRVRAGCPRRISDPVTHGRRTHHPG